MQVEAPVMPIYGVTFAPMTDEQLLELVVGLGATWARNHILWSSIEPVKGQIDWSALEVREQEWANAAANGLKQIVIVQHAPTWAQKYAGVACGQIKEDELGGFANFMSELVRRYSIAPYMVKYWEIWNEEDIAIGTIDPNSGWGCWGDASDAYFGEGIMQRC
jgi:hypothetical protein